MTSNPLLIFDFDGVLIDGMPEYWWSSRKACIDLLNGRIDAAALPEEVPGVFRHLRPWIHHGWEMVLLAAEMLRSESSLLIHPTESLSSAYPALCEQALKAWGWHHLQLQNALEDVRRSAIATNQKDWIARHKAFPGVFERIAQLDQESIEWAVLTTKGADFTAELLDSFDLKPNLLFGHESGTKPAVLLELAKDRCICGFIEDRLATLKAVLATPGLSFLPCYLASWGYLKPEDTQRLPEGIRLINPKTLATPLANWS